MQLEEKGCSCGKFLRHALGEFDEGIARYVGGKGSGVFPIESVLACSENKDVMNYFRGRWPNLCGLHPAVPGEVGFHAKVDVGHLSSRLDLNFPWQGKDNVGLTDCPLAFSDNG